MGTACSSESKQITSNSSIDTSTKAETNRQQIDETKNQEVNNQKSQKVSFQEDFINNLTNTDSRKMPGASDDKKRKKRTFSVIQMERHDVLELRHPEMKNVLEDFDNATEKIPTMHNKSYLDDIITILQDKFVNYFNTYAQPEQRELMGDHLVKIHFVPVIVNYYQFILNNMELEAITEADITIEDDDDDDDDDTDDEDEDMKRIIRHLRYILWNYSDNSKRLGEEIANSKMFVFLVKDLQKMGAENIENIKGDNFAFSSAVNIIVIRLQTLLVLSHIVNDKQFHYLTADDNLLNFLIDMIEMAMKAKDHRYDGFSVEELLAGLSGMARNDEIISRIIALPRPLPLIREVILKGNEKEQLEACGILHKTAFKKTNNEKIMNDSGLWKKLHDLRDSDYEDLSEAAKIAIFTINDFKKEKETIDTQQAEYAYQLNKEKMFVRLQYKYSPRSWLGAIIGISKYYDFSGHYEISEKFKDLIKDMTAKYFEIEARKPDGESQKKLDQPSASNPVRVTTREQVQSAVIDTSLVLNKWSRSEMEEWLKKNKLEKFSGLKTLSGEQLTFLYKVFQRAPEFFYRCIEQKLGITSLEDLMRFSNAVEKLSETL
ncbi:hypothetical protein KUTeg_017956 [Tegillarca granosa]|uniref:Uncharacterized protein n=1 Tax=Tegillarca granosa TaxID=220873 RepID=A0ABQ9EGF5_TEGGR|nr:hypothetical protein KUTeg_017956 [Tegillarca granosa]